MKTLQNPWIHQIKVEVDFNIFKQFVIIYNELFIICKEMLKQLE